MNQQQIADLLCQGRLEQYTLHNVTSTMQQAQLYYIATIGRDDYENAKIGTGLTPSAAAINALKKWKEVAP